MMNEMVGNQMKLSNMYSVLNTENETSKKVSLKLSRSSYDGVYRDHKHAADRIVGGVEPLKGYRVLLAKDINDTEELVYGPLTSHSISNGIVIFDNLFQPQIAASLFFVVQEDIYPSAKVDEILRKTTLAPGIEMLDSRMKNWSSSLSLSERITDNRMFGRVVVGNTFKVPSSKSFEKIKVSLLCDGELVKKGHSKDLEPLDVMKRLVNKLTAEGKFLKKGMIISTGHFTLPKALYKGVYQADFGNLGSVTLKVR